jgi:transcription termination factor NusB
MKTAIEIVDDINIELMQLNRAHAVADQSNKSYFQGMIDALKNKREDLMLNITEHSDKISAALDRIERARSIIEKM